jgi:hypothetical protein
VSSSTVSSPEPTSTSPVEDNADAVESVDPSVSALSTPPMTDSPDSPDTPDTPDTPDSPDTPNTINAANMEMTEAIETADPSVDQQAMQAAQSDYTTQLAATPAADMDSIGNAGHAFDGKPFTPTESQGEENGHGNEVKAKYESWGRYEKRSRAGQRTFSVAPGRERVARSVRDEMEPRGWEERDGEMGDDEWNMMEERGLLGDLLGDDCERY